MLLLCCLPEEIETSARLLEELKRLPGPPALERVLRTAQLAQRLQQPRPQGLLCLALLPARQDLHDLLAMQHLLQDIPLVLALPDDAPQTLALAHRLRARYLTYMQRPDAHQLMAQVVARVLDKYSRPWEPPAGSGPGPGTPGDDPA
ncbi:MAG: hypothetical protein V1806_07855 [Pseudomonadota bacterium]